MDASALVARLRARREKWVEVEPAAGDKPAKEIRIIRPPESEFWRFGQDGASVDIACDFVTGWRGVTEADLLGEAVGASDPVDFDSALWKEVVRDRTGWLNKAASAVSQSVMDHIEQSKALEKN